MVVLNRNVSLLPAGVYVIVLGAVLVFGGVNWFLPLEDEQVLLYNRTGGYVFFSFSQESC